MASERLPKNTTIKQKNIKTSKLPKHPKQHPEHTVFITGGPSQLSLRK
jgi:hypothetical protein